MPEICAAAREHTADFGAFVQASPTSYHAAVEARRRLGEVGFEVLVESEPWQLKPGGRYVVLRDGAVIAFALPLAADPAIGFTVLGTHTDSPGFKLKPHSELAGEGFWQLAVEVYGSPFLDSFLDRELELAGRLVSDDGVFLTRSGPLLRIPHLAIHLDRTANEALTLDRQRHIQPLWALGDYDGPGIFEFLARRATPIGREVTDLVALDPTQITGYDLLVADTQPPRTFGADNQMWASGRLDNLLGTHAALTALAQQVSAESENSTLHTVPMLAAFDHEEVGSQTRSGAAGSFLEDVLGRIHGASGASPEERAQSLARSLLVSADVGHGVHPNYPEKHDPTNRPLVGGGPILKHNANQRYATDGPSAAQWRKACERAGVPCQEFVSRNDLRSGSTIGPMAASRLGLRTVDVGVAILSMHSARGLAAVVDPWYLSRAMFEVLARPG